MHYIFEYLDKLKNNNSREWFHANKEEFEKAKYEAHRIFDNIYQELSKIEELEPIKKYRINRDIRFSLDKTPYKTHFSAFIGRKKPYNRGGFYIHFESNKCFIAGGFWGPEKEDLLRIRQAIDYSDELENILRQKPIVQSFGILFGEELKTAPKGFPKDHERIELLRKKQFLLIKNLKDEEVYFENFAKTVCKEYKILLPFFDYMTEVLTTNSNGEIII